MQMLSRAEEIILLAVLKLDENAYGVTIRDQIHGDIGRHWSFGVIYKTLKKMKAKGYVDKTSGGPTSERGGRTRYYYRLTPAGRSVLDEIRTMQVSLWDGIRNLSIPE
jgi:PadR family transcriptional regulator PadR